MMLRHRGIVRIAAAIPAPRGEPPERLVNARDPGFLGPAGVAHEAVHEQLGESLVECARQGVDETRVFHVDVDHRQIAVELQARRGSALRSHDSTSASSTRRVGQPFSIARLQSFSSGW